MKIGKFVRQHIRDIFDYCDDIDEHNEINCLLNEKYSKKIFGIDFPFCIEVKNIDDAQQKKESKRYWAEEYSVRGKGVRVTNHWIEKNKNQFMEYLISKDIEPTENIKEIAAQRPSRRSNSRYGGRHIGNAQNQFIRNILSSLGVESFNKEDWLSTKDYFSHKCAYCGDKKDLLMEHAIPINKEKLGEHRLGNLVPSCKSCNSSKGGKDFREFLRENKNGITSINKIKEYMSSKEYLPLEDTEQIKRILNDAHKEIATLADKYIDLANKHLSQKKRGSTNEPEHK